MVARNDNKIVKAKNSLKVYKGYHYRVLEIKGFPSIVFGCPPGLVKDYGRRKKPLPRHYVFPAETVLNGRNIFDFEFVIYTFLFMKAGKTKVSIYCTSDQRSRFLSILQETLFGPRLNDLLHAQNHGVCIKNNFSRAETGKFNSFLNQVAANRTLFNRFSYLLQAHAGERMIEKEIREFFEDRIQKKKWLQQKGIAGLTRTLAKNYLICAQIKKETSGFSPVDEGGRDDFLHQVVEFKIFDQKQSVYIQGEKDKRKKIKIVKGPSLQFEIHQQNKKLGCIQMNPSDPPNKLEETAPVQKPFMGVTYVGVGSGFSPNRKNSCLIAWSEGRGIMVDSVSDSNRVIGHHGLRENDIYYVFLTHVHSDHDVGLAERILSGQRTRIISTRIIYESFLRKVEAINGFPMAVLQRFVEFLEVEPGKKVRLPGFKSTYFTFDYSFHSIPAGRFRLTYKDKTGKETVISHSGDTKFNVGRIHERFRIGDYSRNRRDRILGFIWDADLVIHDVGGGTLHTKISELNEVDGRIVKNMVLVHQHEDPPAGSRYRFAREGQTNTLIEKDPNGDSPAAEFSGSDSSRPRELELFKILNRSKVVRDRTGETVFANGGTGKTFYIVLDGNAELIIDGKCYTGYGKGRTFGEFPESGGPSGCNILCRGKSGLILLEIPFRYYKKFTLPETQEVFDRLQRSMDETGFSGLIASVAFGKLTSWEDKVPSLMGEGKKQGLHIVISGKLNVEGENGYGKVCLTQGDIVGGMRGFLDIPRPIRILAHQDEGMTVRLTRNGLLGVLDLFPRYRNIIEKRIRRLKTSLF